MKRTLLIFAIFSLALASCKKETKSEPDPEPEPEPVKTEPKYEGTATLTFDARVGDEDFALNKNFSINNRTYYLDYLRYWVSNVVLIKTDGSEYSVPKSYYLIEETNERSVIGRPTKYPARKRENVVINDIPAGNYKAIRFSIGVDATHNNNQSLQDGELSQTDGMINVDSWSWNTSYIFTALGGYVSEGSTTKQFQVETGLNANYKTVTLTLPKTSSSKSTTLILKVDVPKIIDGLDLIAVSTISANFPTQMSTVSGNYETKVFSTVSAD